MITNTTSPSISKALQSENKEHWIKAINLEMQSLLNEKILIPINYNELPYEFEYIDLTTKLKLKFKSNGQIDKFKARSCARGDQLQHTYSPAEIFSPTISDDTFLLLMQLSIIYSWECTNIDTISAFLHQSRPPTAIKIYTRVEQKICNLCQAILYHRQIFIRPPGLWKSIL